LEEEADSCPGCNASFLLPTTFFQHLYRRSVRIRFECRHCNNQYLEFSNKCLFRIHLLSHLELEEGEEEWCGALQTEFLELNSLEISELINGKAINSSSSLLSNHRRTQSQLAKSAGEAQCMECLALFASQTELQQHLQAAGSSLPRCADCQRAAGSACSLAAHRRIHGRRPPYVCPECGREFLTWTIFKMHLSRSCLHDARLPLHRCPECPADAAALLFPCPPASSSSVPPMSLVNHLIECHMRTAWKCGRCARAFGAKDRLRGHARAEHRGQRTPYYRLYRPPVSLVNRKNPGIFFKSRDALRSYLATEIHLPASFGYACNGCDQTYFLSADELAGHAEQCRHSFTADELYAERPLDDRYLEAVDDLRRMSSEGGLAHCRGCLKHCRNFRNHICRHHARQDGPEIKAAQSDSVVLPTLAISGSSPPRGQELRKKNITGTRRLDGIKKLRGGKAMGDPSGGGNLPAAPAQITPLKLTIKLGNCTADNKLSPTAAPTPTAVVIKQPASSSLGSISGTGNINFVANIGTGTPSI
jgi:hypothetical protein